MRFNLIQLRAFLAAADTLNFTVAADRVHVAQPTFSATIRNLEEEVGAKLFERSSRKVRLTPVGAQFVPLARRVLAEVDRATLEMTDLVTMRRGSVRFSALPVLYAHYLQKALAQYRADWPGVRLELFDLSTGEAIEQLRRDQLDLAIVAQVGEENDLDFHPLCERTVVAVLPPDHPLATTKTIEWRRVLKEKTVLLQGAGPMGSHVDTELLKAGLRFVPDYHVGQLPTAAGLIGAGFGVGVMSNLTAGALEHEGLVVRELVRPRISRPLSLVRLAGREPAPAARQLYEMVEQHWAGPRMAAAPAARVKKPRK